MTVESKVTVGVVGLGKLGLPLAVTLAIEGFSVIGYDLDDSRMTPDALADWELDRKGSGLLLDEFVDTEGTELRFAGLNALVEAADCIFVAVETPHQPLYEGVTPLPSSRADFDYTFLRRAVGDIVAAANQKVTIGIISTVLPGTIRREILPITQGHNLVYCPQFIAMGRTSKDFLNPEFILIGTDTNDSVIAGVFGALSPQAPVIQMKIESAELTKIIYNTYISTKIAISNLIQHVSDVAGADAIDVFGAIRQGTRRITSAAYIGPGLGDGGPCHPRDNIALSWLVREAGFRTDLFTAIMNVRYEYTAWLADQFVSQAGDRPLVLLGTSYKASIPIETGSAAVLLAHILSERGIEFDTVPRPSTDATATTSTEAKAYFIGCPEPAFYEVSFGPGSLVFDPWCGAVASPQVEVVFPGAGAVRRVGPRG